VLQDFQLCPLSSMYSPLDSSSQVTTQLQRFGET